jgi:hypothetical protein
MPHASASIPMSIRHGRRPPARLSAPARTCLPCPAVTTLSARCQLSMAEAGRRTTPSPANGPRRHRRPAIDRHSERQKRQRCQVAEGRARSGAKKANPSPAGVVGLGRFERPTSRLSGVRSNQLSYRPPSQGQASSSREAKASGRPEAGPPERGRRLLTSDIWAFSVV